MRACARVCVCVCVCVCARARARACVYVYILPPGYSLFINIGNCHVIYMYICLQSSNPSLKIFETGLQVAAPADFAVLTGEMFAVVTLILLMTQTRRQRISLTPASHPCQPEQQPCPRALIFIDVMTLTGTATV